MYRNNDNYYGIYVNNKKIPKPQDITKKRGYYNKYLEEAKLQFEGKAYYIRDKEKNKVEELDNNSKITNRGKHLIKFINSNNEVYYIKLKVIKVRFLCLFLLGILLFCGIFAWLKQENPSEKYELLETSNFQIDIEGINYVFNINYGDTDFQNINLADSIRDSEFIYPGTSGDFFITVSTLDGDKDMFYDMQVLEEKNKPRNLKFQTNGDIYNSMSELAERIRGGIDKNSEQKLKIYWFWDYENDSSNYDTEDTKDGTTPDKYEVKIRFSGNEIN